MQLSVIGGGGVADRGGAGRRKKRSDEAGLHVTDRLGDLLTGRPKPKEKATS